LRFVYLFVALAVLVIACRYGLGPFLIWPRPPGRRSGPLVLAGRRHPPPLALTSLAPCLSCSLTRVIRGRSAAPRLPRPAASRTGSPGCTSARRYGVTATLRTVAGVGLTEVEKHAQHLADAWGCVRVAVTQLRPGQVRIRAVRRDPLTIPTEYQPDCTALAVPDDLDRVYLGLDEYGDPVEIRLSGVSGITVAGLPGAARRR
jgi:S-DNA-T family DNA segregation ATPase FtsK/SpoIIIE